MDFLRSRQPKPRATPWFSAPQRGTPSLAHGKVRDQRLGHLIGPTGHHPSAQGHALGFFSTKRNVSPVGAP